MECSIRLLRLKGSMPTFSNLYANIQDLANQNFTYNQLAQMKHILPEAIMVKKVLLRDESTCCMKPELQISLNVECVGINMKEEGQNAYLHLTKVFRQRLVDFVKSPSRGEMPEEELPHPFNKSNVLSSPKITSENTSLGESQSVVLSHMSPSFQETIFSKGPNLHAKKVFCLIWVGFDQILQACFWFSVYNIEQFGLVYQHKQVYCCP